MEAFAQWPIEDWIKEILNPNSLLPLEASEKLRFLNFAVVLTEQLWLFRNRTRLELRIPVQITALYCEILQGGVCY